MKDTQNITLSLPRDLLKQIRRVAADRETSISAIVAEALARVADQERRYTAARRRGIEAIRRPQSLGTNGKRSWARDELHER